MAGADVEVAVQCVGDVELLQGDLAALLHFGLVLAVLGLFHLGLDTYAAGLELDLSTYLPVLVELIVTGQHKAGDGDGVAALVGVARRGAVEAAGAVAHEGSHHLAVAADAEFLKALAALLGLGAGGSSDGHECGNCQYTQECFHTQFLFCGCKSRINERGAQEFACKILTNNDRLKQSIRARTIG